MTPPFLNVLNLLESLFFGITRNKERKGKHLFDDLKIGRLDWWKKNPPGFLTDYYGSTKLSPTRPRHKPQ